MSFAQLCCQINSSSPSWIIWLRSCQLNRMVPGIPWGGNAKPSQLTRAQPEDELRIAPWQLELEPPFEGFQVAKVRFGNRFVPWKNGHDDLFVRNLHS